MSFGTGTGRSHRPRRCLYGSRGLFQVQVCPADGIQKEICPFDYPSASFYLLIDIPSDENGQGIKDGKVKFGRNPGRQRGDTFPLVELGRERQRRDQQWPRDVGSPTNLVKDDITFFVRRDG